MYQPGLPHQHAALLTPSRIAPRNARRGVAIVMALLTLFLMLSLAVPFVLTANHHEAAAISYSAQVEARIGAESARDYTISALRSRETLSALQIYLQEQEVGQDRDDPWNPKHDPWVDTPEEYFVDVAAGIRDDFPALFEGPAEGRLSAQRGVWEGEFSAADETKRIWSAYVQDEQGKININTAPPALLGNLLGSGIVVQAEADTGEFEMSEGYEYFPDNAPSHFVINGVLFRYESREGSKFYGVQAVAPYNTNYLPGAGPMFFEDSRAARMVLAGISEDNPTLAIPLKAFLISYYRLIDARNTQTKRYRTIDEVKSISDFNLLDVDLERNAQQGGSSFADRLSAEEWVAMRPFITVDSRGPMNNGFFYTHIADQVGEWEMESGRAMRNARLMIDDVINPEWLVRPSQGWFIDGDPRYNANGQNVGRGFPSGSTVRLRYPDSVDPQPYYCMATFGSRQGALISLSTPGPQPPLVTNLAGTGGRFPFERRPIVEVQEITPININTAPLEVLVANMKGLYGIQPSDGGVGTERAVVTQADAVTVARAIQYVVYGEGYSDPNYRFLAEIMVPSDERFLEADELRFGGLRGNRDLNLLLNELVDAELIEPGVHNAIMTQQRRPYAPRPVMTAPFCFRSFSPTTIDALATTFTSAGLDAARSHIREVVSVGRDNPGIHAVYDWRDWRQMADELQRPQGNIMTLEPPSRFNQVSERGEREYALISRPWLLDPQAIPPTRGVQVWRLTDSQAANLDASALLANVRQADPGSMPPGTPASLVNRNVGQLQGGNLAFWYRVPQGVGSGATDAYIFDAAERRGTNRMSLLWWGAGRFGGKLATDLPGLCFRIADRTLESAYIATVMKPDRDVFYPGQWYHFDLRWKGLEPGHTSMIVDGVGRLGDSTSNAVQSLYIVDYNGTWVARSAESAAPLTWDLGHTADSESLSVQGGGNNISAAFEPMGVIQVGDVPVEYRTVSGAGFSDLVVGTGGTRNDAERRTERGIQTNDPVGVRGPRIVGGQTGGPALRQLNNASQPITTGAKISPFGYTLDVIAHPLAPRVAAGGSSLAYTLRGPGVFRVTGLPDATSNDDYYAPAHLGPEAGFPGDDTQCPLDNVADLPGYGMVYVYGPCWKSYTTVDVRGEQKMVPDRARAGETPRQPIMVHQQGFTLGDCDGEYIVFRRSASGIEVIQRLDQNFQVKDPLDYYYFLGGPAQMGLTTHEDANEPVTMLGYDPNNPNNAIPPFHLTGSIATLCSFAGNQRGDYLDPAQLRPNLAGRAHCYVSVNDEWLPYHRIWDITSGPRLFCYTLSGRLRTIAINATRAFENGTTPELTTSTANRLLSMNVQEMLGEEIRTLDPLNLTLRTHSLGSRIVPVFAVNGLRSGPNDLVTLLTPPNSNKIERRIAQAKRIYLSIGTVNSGFAQMIAFERETLQAFNPGAQMLKFPSHTMPDGIPTTLRFGGPDPLAQQLSDVYAGGEIDELKLQSFAIGDFRVTRDIAPNDTQIFVNSGAAGMPGDVGMIKIDGELIVYRQRTQAGAEYRLTDLTRGVLGTVRAAHAAGSGLLNLSGFPVFVYDQNSGINFTADEHEIHLIGGEGAPLPYGFLRVEPGTGWNQSQVEIIGYNRTTGNAARAMISAGSYRPLEPMGLQPALFRGAYGTQRRSWDERAVITQLPVREPDFYPQWMRPLNAPLTRSPEIAHAQGTLMVDSASISKLNWYMSDMGVPVEVRDSIQARLVVRFNGSPDWSTNPSRSGPLFVQDFDWGAAEAARDGSGSEVMEFEMDDWGIPKNVDKLEWRVYLFYKDGAYARGRWKGDVAFRGITAEMNTRTKTLSHEELR